MKKQSTIKIMIYAAMFLVLAYVIPFLTGQIPQIGSMLCPMHIPVLLCGFICGWPWGIVVGFSAPLLRSMILTMPPLFPKAVCMAFELATYGAIAGILYKALPKKKLSIYVSLLAHQRREALPSLRRPRGQLEPHQARLRDRLKMHEKPFLIAVFLKRSDLFFLTDSIRLTKVNVRTLSLQVWAAKLLQALSEKLLLALS